MATKETPNVDTTEQAWLDDVSKIIVEEYELTGTNSAQPMIENFVMWVYSFDAAAEDLGYPELYYFNTRTPREAYEEWQQYLIDWGSQ